MAIRPGRPERPPLDNCEVEYERPAAGKRDRPASFYRARILDIGEDRVEIAAREAFQKGEKALLTFHIKTVRDYLNVSGVVENCALITCLKQSAFGVTIKFDELSADEQKRLQWARDQLMPKRASLRPVRRAEEPSESPASGVSEAAAAETSGAAPATAPASAAAEASSTTVVQRPVALLELIDHLDKFQVTDDLLLAVIEAAEAGMDVQVLYPISEQTQTEDVESGEEEAAAPALPTAGEARPINVYRLTANARLPFSEAGVPVGPPVELFYLSRIKSPERHFGIELGMDNMTQSGAPSFKRGVLLVFCAEGEVRSGGFAFVKLRAADEFAQVFLDKPDEVRLRPLNPKYPERVVRRSEVRRMCRLVGCYEDHESD